MIYIACPYSSPLHTVCRDRYQRCLAFTVKCLKEQQIVFSPIAYMHPIATQFNLPGDAGFWMPFNLEYLRHSHGLYLLRLHGWEKSKGVRVELNIAHALNIPIIHYSGTTFQPVDTHDADNSNSGLDSDGNKPTDV